MWPPLTKEDEPTFWSKKWVRVETWMGTSFSNFFLEDLDEKMTLAGYRRKRNKNESNTVLVWEAINLFNLLAFVTFKLEKDFSLRSQQMVPNYFLYPYQYPEFHLRKIWPQFWANRHFPDGVGHYDGLHTNWQIKAPPMACWIGKVSRELGFYWYYL